LADSGGYAGVCCIPEFLGGKGDVAAFLDHIDYIVRKVGVDHVAIGTDVAHASHYSEHAQRKLPPRRRQRRRWAWLWPGVVFGTTPATGRDSLAWTNWPLFTVGLVQRGYRDEEVQKIIGGNVMRVARAALAGVHHS
jgi:membrane dipeptidase